MEMHQLRYFAKVAELGNVTRAAEAGRLFRRYADQILSLTADACTRVADTPDSGRIVLAVIPTIAPYFLPAVLTRFAKQCPKAQVEIVEDTTGNILRLLAEGDADLAILALPIQAEHVHTKTLFTEELLAVLPSRHPLAKQPKLGLKDLATEPFVVLNEAHCLTRSTISFCERHAVSTLITAKSHQLLTVLELVRLGLGVSLFPAMAVPKGRDHGREYRSLSGDQPSRTIALAWNRRHYQTQLFKRFVQFLSGDTASRC